MVERKKQTALGDVKQCMWWLLKLKTLRLQVDVVYNDFRGVCEGCKRTK